MARRASVLDESGAALTMVLIVGAVMLTMMFYLASRAVNFKRHMTNNTNKTQIVNDRTMIIYDLRTRPLPTPSP